MRDRAEASVRVAGRARWGLALGAAFASCLSVVVLVAVRADGLGPPAPTTAVPTGAVVGVARAEDRTPGRILATPEAPEARDGAAEEVASAPGPASEPEAALVPEAPLARVVGRVTTADGAGAVDVAVRLVPEDGGPPLAAVTGYDGAFRLEEVAAGAHRLAVVAAGGADEQPFLRGEPVRVVPPETVLPDLELPRLGAVEVRVVDETGRSVPGAEVECVGHPIGRRTLETDLDGVARFEGLPPGAGRVHARAGELGRGNRPFEVVPGRAQRVELLLWTPRSAPERRTLSERSRTGGEPGPPGPEASR